MRPTRQPVRVVAALVAAGVAVAAFAGCTPGPVQDFVGQQAEDAIESTTGGDVSLGGELPAGFPAEVPLVEGEISFSAGSGGA